MTETERIRMKDWIAYLKKQKENSKLEDSWHKVKDSLPDNTREVICKDAIGNFFIGRYYKGSNSWEVSMYDDCDKSNEDNPPVVMWCDIPSEKQKEAEYIKRNSKEWNALLAEQYDKGFWKGKAEQKPAEKLSKEEYVKRFKALCDVYEVKLPELEYDIYHLCNDLAKLSIDSDKQKPAEESGTAEPDYGICDDYIPASLHHALKRHGWYATHIGEKPDKEVIKYVEATMEQKLIEPELKIPNWVHGGWDDEYMINTVISRYSLHAEVAKKQGNTHDYNLSKAMENWLRNVVKPLILEKQKVQKPTEWSEEDKMNLNGCICTLHQYGYLTYADFLKHLPERFNLQPKQEWSEEDIKKIRSEEYTKGFNDAAFGGKAWKPNKEQMAFLESQLGSYMTLGEKRILKSLIGDLKKLIYIKNSKI